MCGNKLRRGQGISFDCVGPTTKKGIVIATQEMGIHIFYQSSLLLPFVCVPLKHNGSLLGILGVDTFDNVSKVHEAPGEPPEHGVLHFLQGVGASVGQAIDVRRKCDSLAMLHLKYIDLITL